MIVYIRSFVLLSMIIMCSCGKQLVDTTPPTMEVTEYSPTPTEENICGSLEADVFTLSGGDLLSFDAIFEDNDALSQYKIDIHNNFDCHGHGGGSAPSVAVPNTENETLDWSILDIQDITGNSAPIFRALDVPENVTAGNYHFHIQVIDISGNDSPFANFFSLKITNPLDELSPEITVEKPSTSNFTLSKGESINFKGQVTDNRSLSDGGNGVLYLAYTDLSSGNTFTTNEVFIFDENIDDTFDFEFDYSIPSTFVAGKYQFSLGANDGLRNVASFMFFEVDITN